LESAFFVLEGSKKTLNLALNPADTTAGPSTTLPRISYFAAIARTTGAVSRKGNRMKMINATSLDRKSGGA
jgi:hypothetical protein